MILLILLAVILLAAAALAIWQWDNLKALYTAKTQSTEQIAAEAELTKQEQREIFAERGITITPPSLEDLERMIDEGAARTEAGEDPVPTPTPDPSPPAETPGTAAPTTPAETPIPEPSESPEPDGPTEQELIDAAAQALYAYEAEVMGRLGGIKASAIAEYRALPPEEQNGQAKMSIGLGALNACYAMEGEVDGKVQSILSQLRSDLTAIGADTSIADTMWSYYCGEKANAKSYYMSKYF